MNFFQFIIAFWTVNAESARAFAWPTVVLVSVWLLRDPLSRLLPGLEKLKWGNAEVSFRELLSSLDKKADDEKVPEIPAVQAASKNTEEAPEIHVQPKAKLELPDLRSRLLSIEQMAENEQLSPALIVVVAMDGLKDDLRILLGYENIYDLNMKLSIPATLWAEMLRARGYLSRETTELIEGLQKSSEYAISNPDKVSKVDALAFSNLVTRARLSIRADS